MPKPSGSPPPGRVHPSGARDPRGPRRPEDGPGLHLPNPAPGSRDANHPSGPLAFPGPSRNPAAPARAAALRRFHETVGGDSIANNTPRRVLRGTLRPEEVHVPPSRMVRSHDFLLPSVVPAD